MINGLTFLRDVPWEEVFGVWKANEGQDSVWHEVAKQKGFDTWEDWRRNSLTPLEPEQKKWAIYAIDDVHAVVPAFQVGPFPAWQKQFEEKNTHTFSDLIRLRPEWVRENQGIQARKATFPVKTEFIGVYLENENRIVLIEGHHRAAAIALKVFEGGKIDTQAKIALTVLAGDQKPFLDSLLARGTEGGARGGLHLSSRT